MKYEDTDNPNSTEREILPNGDILQREKETINVHLFMKVFKMKF